MYKLSREGKTVERKARTVTIHELEMISWAAPDLVFRARCSKGTYIRTLAEDLAKALGTCGHLRELRRTTSGVFTSGMVTLEELEKQVEQGTPESLLLPPDAGLTDWPVTTLDQESTIRFSHGNPVPSPDQSPGLTCVYSEKGLLLGLGEIVEKQLRPKRILNLNI